MAGKRFGALDLLQNINTVLMSGATEFSSTVNVRFVNRNSVSVRVRLALVDAPSAGALAALADEDYLEFDLELRANGVLENSGVVVPADYSLVVRADSDDVTAVAFGFQEENI